MSKQASQKFSTGLPLLVATGFLTVFLTLSIFLSACSSMELKLTNRPSPAVSTPSETALQLGQSAKHAFDKGNYRQARSLYLQLLATDQAKFGQQHTVVADDLKQLAKVAVRVKDWQEAEKRYQAAMLMDENLLGGGHARVLSGLNDLAMVYDLSGKHTEAEVSYQRALSVSEALHQDEFIILTSVNLSSMYIDQGRHLDGEVLLKRAFKLIVEGPSPFETIALTSTPHKKSKSTPKGTSKISNKITAPKLAIHLKPTATGPSVYAALNNMATIYRHKQDYQNAEVLYEKALALAEKSLPENDPNLAILNNNLADIYRKTDRILDAKALEAKAIIIQDAVVGANQPDEQKPHS